MKKEILIYNIKCYINQLIDDIMPPNNFINKIENRTAKYWIEQNQWRLDDILSAFTDKDDYIDEKCLIKQYEDVLFEDKELRLSIKEIVPDKYKSYLPDKVILFTVDDLYKLIGVEQPI